MFYVCTDCGKAFKSSKTLREHRAKFHAPAAAPPDHPAPAPGPAPVVHKEAEITPESFAAALDHALVCDGQGNCHYRQEITRRRDKLASILLEEKHDHKEKDKPADSPAPAPAAPAKTDAAPASAGRWGFKS